MLTTAVVLAAVGSGLLAGLYWAFSVAVVPALAREPDPAAAAVMQRVNQVVLRPAFLVVFAGTPLVGLVAAVLALLDGGPALPWVLAGTALQVLASFVLTATYHVPRNTRLDAVDPTSPEGQGYWRTYVREWTRANHVRAAGCAVAVAAYGWALHLG